MTRSERLAKSGKVDIYIGSCEIADVISNCNAKKGLRYIGTDYDCRYNNKDVNADVYEDIEGNLYAVIN